METIFDEENLDKALAGIDESFPGLQVWFSAFLRPGGLLITLHDRNHNVRYPSYLLVVDWDMILPVLAGDHRAFPGFTLDQYRQNQESGGKELPSGYVTAEGRRAE